MSMQESARGLRATGDPRDEAWAAVIDGIREARGSDIPLPTIESSAEVQQLSTEQKRGLAVVEFDLVVPVLAKSVGQLYREEEHRFGYVNSSESMRAIVPPAAQVAVRSRQLAIPRSGNLTLDDQRQMVADLAKEAVRTVNRKRRKDTTLTGVEFGLDDASTHVQTDFTYQNRNSGRPLYVDLHARTENTTSGSHVALVGRRPGHSRLDVHDWGSDDGDRGVVAVPVARPARK